MAARSGYVNPRWFFFLIFLQIYFCVLFIYLYPGAEFVAPLPEKTNHFSCVFVFHAKSGTIHINDTIMVGFKPGVLLKLGGIIYEKINFV